MDNLEKMLKETLSQELYIPKSYVDKIDNAFASLENKPKFFHTKIMKNFCIAACCTICLITGTVFAKEIQNFFIERIGLGKGVETAIENGYVEYLDNNSQKCKAIINNKKENLVNTNISINSFFIDDHNLSIQFNFELDQKIKEFIDLNNINSIFISDLVVIDENNKVLYSNINNEYDNQINSGINISSIEYNEESNTITTIYNIYTEKENFPHSEKINIKFKMLNFKTNTSKLELTLLDYCNMQLIVPENMYNRSEIPYKVLNCTNNDFEIYASKLTETGFEVGIIISNIEKPIYPSELLELDKQFYNNNTNNIQSKNSETQNNIKKVITSSNKTEEKYEVYKNSIYKDLYENYYRKYFPIGNISQNYIPWIEKTDGCYILDSNNNKFEPSAYVGGKGTYKFIENNKYDYYSTFEMTKYNATNKITAIIEVYGIPFKVEFEKIQQ